MSEIKTPDGVPSNAVIIVGGGLSGLSAVHQIIMNGGNTILLDKQKFIGGNSTKATSGINGAYTTTQQKLGIQDSIESFKEDTLKSAKKLANQPLIDVLVENSAPAIDWLIKNFGLDLSVVSRLGGHSFPRTHRGHDKKFPGMAITYALMEKYDELCQAHPDNYKLFLNSKIVDLLKDGDDKVVGCIYEDSTNGEKYKLYGPVIMATGGYAADFESTNSFIKKYRPDIVDLPSSNGTHATGDGQKLIIAKGGVGIDLDKIQVHPTGLLPFDQKILKDDKFLFLGAELLRGEGGIMLNSKGERFCDELGTRDYVSGKMVETIKKTGSSKIMLVLNAKSENKLQFHLKHYMQRGLMKKISTSQLIKELGCKPQFLAKEIEKYNRGAKIKKDPFGKKFFPTCPFPFKKENGDDEYFYVSYITRIVHFTMGGVKIDSQSQVLSDSGILEGLFAAGELAGGVHGENRLGGSSLLLCVVYGRVAGDSASKYLFSKLANSSASNDTSLLRLNQISLHLDPTNPSRVVVEWNKHPLAETPGGEAELSPLVTKSEPAPSLSPPKQTKTQELKSKDAEEFSIPSKEFTKLEIAKHNTGKDCWVIVKDVVLDVTNFLSSHPGGEQSIINFAGKDATEVFEMLHDDKVIPKYAHYAIIGRVQGTDPKLDL